MHLLPLDFETFWSQDHSLSKMSPIEYVMHPETEIISCSCQPDKDKPPIVVFGEDESRRMLVDCGVESSLALAHNMSGFDALILAWRLKLKPKMWGCTMHMARPHYGRTVGLALAKLVKHLNIGVKDSTALNNTKGRHLKDFTPDEIEAMRVYNGDDTWQCRALFAHLRPLTSNREMWIIDSNIRMMVEDEFVVDQGLLEAALAREQASKRKTLLALASCLWPDREEEVNDEVLAGQVKTELMSAPKFAALLEERGVEVPVKPSPKNEDIMIPAFAKTDLGFQELLDHDDPLVSMAARARLQVKSTLLESRIQAFLATAAVREGKLPVPTRYAGAHTMRDSGEIYNCLNLPSILRDSQDRIIPKLSNVLRLSIRAPRGKVIGVADLSGIEMRINHFLWKVAYSTALWKENPKADIYKPTASRYFGIPVEEVNKEQRQYGKILQLACQFGAGAKSFRSFSRKYKLEITEEQAQEGVYGWRNITPEIADKRLGGWARCGQALEHILAGDEIAIDPYGLLHTCREGIVLPDGNVVRYHDLRQVVDERTGRPQWKYGHGRHTSYLHPAKITENVVQALGRVILMDNVIEFFKRTGVRPKLRVYDEAAFIADKEVAAELLAELLKIMRTAPKWWPELVVYSEGDLSESYGLAK